MPFSRMSLAALVFISATGVAFAQTRDNKALDQAKDVEKNSRDAAGTKNPEAAKQKSGVAIDTAGAPSVRAPAPDTRPKAERDAEALRRARAQPDNNDQLRAIARRPKTEPPSPGAQAKPAAVKPATTTTSRTTTTPVRTSTGTVTGTPSRPATNYQPPRASTATAPSTYRPASVTPSAPARATTSAPARVSAPAPSSSSSSSSTSSRPSSSSSSSSSSTSSSSSSSSSKK